MKSRKVQVKICAAKVGESEIRSRHGGVPGGCNNMRYPETELGHTLSHRVLLPSNLELNKCVGKCDLIHGIDGDISMTNQARMRLLRYAYNQCLTKAMVFELF